VAAFDLLGVCAACRHTLAAGDRPQDAAYQPNTRHELHIL